MDLIFTIFAFLILIGIIVAIHEGGHFLTAIWCNIKVMEFSIGFGPKIIQKTWKVKNDPVLFTIRLLPLGGFVKPLDQQSVSPEEWESFSEEDKARSFKNAPRYKKSIMVFGGPFANFVLAFAVYLFASTIVGNQGLPATISEIAKDSVFQNSGLKSGDTISQIDGKNVYFSSEAQTHIINAAFSGTKITIKTEEDILHTVDFSNFKMYEVDESISDRIGLFFQGKTGEVKINQIMPNSPAEKVGLKVGDTIVALDSQKINDLGQIFRTIKISQKESFDLTVKRQEDILNISITPHIINENGKPTKLMGVVLEVPNSEMKKVHLGIIEGFEQSFYKLYTSTWTTIVSIKKLIFGEISTKAIAGPISIADYSGKSAKSSFYTYLLMIASISIAVGVFNLLPIPMLDGGHLMQYFIESITRKDFSPKQLERFQYFGIVTMTSFFLFAIVNDINRYFEFF